MPKIFPYRPVNLRPLMYQSKLRLRLRSTLEVDLEAGLGLLNLAFVLECEPAVLGVFLFVRFCVLRLRVALALKKGNLKSILNQF